MKHLFLSIGTALLLVSCGSSVSPKMQVLQKKQAILDLNSELNSLKIERENHRQEVAKIQENVNAINAKADTRTDNFSASDTDAKSTIKDAKSTALLLKDTEKANRKLAKAQQKLDRVERKIQKIEGKLDKFNKEIEFVEKNPEQN